MVDDVNSVRYLQDLTLHWTITFVCSGKTRPAEIVPTAEGVYQATYLPTEEGKCKVDVKYGGKPVRNR